MEIKDFETDRMKRDIHSMNRLGYILRITLGAILTVVVFTFYFIFKIGDKNLIMVSLFAPAIYGWFCLCLRYINIGWSTEIAIFISGIAFFPTLLFPATGGFGKTLGFLNLMLDNKLVYVVEDFYRSGIGQIIVAIIILLALIIPPGEEYSD